MPKDFQETQRWISKDNITDKMRKRLEDRAKQISK